MPPNPPFRTLGELESVAAQHTAPAAWAYLAGGSGEERTLERNHRAFERWSLRPRVLCDVRTVDLRTNLLGAPVAAPIFPSALAYQGLFDPAGEVATARAAAGAGVLAMFSTLSSESLEAIASAPAAPRWFQLYLQSDFADSRALVERAERAGYSAIVLTVDVPVLAIRDRQLQGGSVAIDVPQRLGNGPRVHTPARGPTHSDELYRFSPEAATNWSVLERLSSITTLPLVVKGVLTAHDARQAIAHGASGIVVSNHGGRQLDLASDTLDALAEVVAAVGGKGEIYVDGGFRRGSDVLVGLALGAKAVGFGRPLAWALAAGGEAGVARWLDLLKTELAMDLALLGRARVADVDASAIGRAPEARLPARE